MDVINAFDAEIPVPTVPDLKDLSEILKSVNAFDDQTRHDVINELETMTQSQDVKVGIKKILSILETSRQDEDVGRRFVDLMANSIAESIGGGLE
jgi:vesicle-fusing ATPase